MTPRRLTPLAALTLAALAGCAAGSGLPSYTSSSYESSASPLDDAQKALMHNDYFRASRAFEQAAAQTAPPQSNEYHLRAAEAATDGNDYSYAGAILDTLPLAALDPQQQLRWRLLRARALLARNDAAGALHMLPENAANSPLAERVLLLRGRALFRLNDPVGATQTLVQRERLLGIPAMVNENRDAIWSGLGAAPLDASALARAGNTDVVTRGWIELANLAHRNASLEMYEGWRQRYPGHPAQDRLASVMMPTAPAQPAGPAPAYVTPPPGATLPAFNGVPARPGFYALLLPQSGGLAAYADSVHAGFAAAAARAGNPADVRVYDASNPAAAVSAYSQAISEGAGVVVGPLLKANVTALSQAGSPRTPVLALNYLDTGHVAPAGFYQFGLAPEDEARAAAEDAAARGLRRALVLVPANERGARVQAAFSQRLSELGGEVRDSRSYSGEFKDWATPISSLLHYHAVDDKKKLAEMRASATPGVDPQRRNDFDFIFIDAGTNQARQLWPLFRYYHAERVPIYDTATVNEGRGDQDLAGIRFCDAPWMLDTSGTWAPLRGNALNGRNAELARFYALGDDAFLLALRLSQNALHPLDQLPGGTGTLRVGDDGAVHRGLVCAQTTEGEPRLLEAAGAQ
ncbi:MAG: penicillin-binding protein activator [Nevskia sp.]|nr:penicillin-binding protein activator [Nevskia sp.]